MLLNFLRPTHGFSINKADLSTLPQTIYHLEGHYSRVTNILADILAEHRKLELENPEK